MQLLVSLLIVVGFALSIWGARRVYHDARGRLARMEWERALRLELLERHHADIEAAKGDRAAAEASSARWRKGLEDAGLESVTYGSVAAGREFLAEAIIRESATASRGDLALVGIGLLLGLAGALLDVWFL